MSSPPSAVVAGHICLDIIPDLEQLSGEQFQAVFQPGRLVTVGRAALSTGGPVSNTGLALHKLGISTQLMCKVGDDLFGQAVREIISAYAPGLTKGMVIDSASSTSYSVIISPPGIDRIFLHNPGANDTFCAADVDLDVVAHANLFHFGYPPIMRLMCDEKTAELGNIFRSVKSTGVITSLDMAFPGPESIGGRADWGSILRQTLPFVDIFLPSLEEILFLLHRERYQEMTTKHASLLNAITSDFLAEVSRELIEMGAKIVVLKLGESGLYLHTADRATLAQIAPGIDEMEWADQVLWAPCFKVDVVGTTGSGDATIAGFLSGLLRGLSPAQTMSMAVAVGACNVEAADALSGIRSWEATIERVQAGWQKRAFDLDMPGWQWDSVDQVWQLR